MDTQARDEPRRSNLERTAILDYDREEVKNIVRLVGAGGQADRAWLVAAHVLLAQSLRPVYSVNEWQPASATIRKARGSCSQRMACLEAVGRAAGIPSRVRALRVKGSFWYPRFRLVRGFIPRSILLLWPQFYLEKTWVDFDELYAPIERLAAGARKGFANDAESLFEAVGETPVDFMGKTCGMACARPGFDLSGFVLADEGFFDTRDVALERFGSFQHSARGVMFEMIFGGRKSR